MVERSERQYAKQGVGARQRRSGGADRSVAAADDQQRSAAFGNCAAAHFALAAVDQLDLASTPAFTKRRARPFGKLRVGGERAAAAVDQNGDAHHCA